MINYYISKLYDLTSCVTISRERLHNPGNDIKPNSPVLYLPTWLTDLSRPPSCGTDAANTFSKIYLEFLLFNLDIHSSFTKIRGSMPISKLIQHTITLEYEFNSLLNMGPRFTGMVNGGIFGGWRQSKLPGKVGVCRGCSSSANKDDPVAG